MAPIPAVGCLESRAAAEFQNLEPVSSVKAATATDRDRTCLAITPDAPKYRAARPAAAAAGTADQHQIAADKGIQKRRLAIDGVGGATDQSAKIVQLEPCPAMRKVRGRLVVILETAMGKKRAPVARDQTVLLIEQKIAPMEAGIVAVVQHGNALRAILSEDAGKDMDRGKYAGLLSMGQRQAITPIVPEISIHYLTFENITDHAAAVATASLDDHVLQSEVVEILPTFLTFEKYSGAFSARTANLQTVQLQKAERAAGDNLKDISSIGDRGLQTGAMPNDSVGTSNVRFGRDSHGAADAIRPRGDEKEFPSLIRKSRVQGPLQSLSIVTDAVSFRPEIIGSKLTASRRLGPDWRRAGRENSTCREAGDRHCHTPVHCAARNRRWRGASMTGPTLKARSGGIGL